MNRTKMDRLTSDRAMLMLRILVTLLILALLLPPWGPMSASTLAEERPVVTTDAVGTMSPFDR